MEAEEHSLECMNCKSPFVTVGGGCLSQKEQFISQAPMTPASRIPTWSTAWATSAVKTAGLLRFPCGPAFLDQREPPRGEVGQKWRKLQARQRALTWTWVCPWQVSALAKNENVGRGVRITSGLGSACGQCSGSLSFYLGQSPYIRGNTWVLKIIVFAVFDHVILKRFLKLRFRL